MPRTPKPRWHEGNQLWVSDVGEPYVDGRGRTRRRTVSFPGIGRKEERKAREALQAFLDTEAERERNSADPSVATIVELYLEWLEANREPSTFETNAGLLGKFLAYQPPGSKVPLSGVRASAARTNDLEALLREMAQVNAPSYCSAMHGAVQAAFNWAARVVAGRRPERILTSNPFQGVPKPKVPRSPERYSERAELAAFLRWAWRRAGSRKGSRGRSKIKAGFDKQLCLLIRLVAHTAARPGELTIAGRKYRPRGFMWDYWEPNAYVNDLGQRVGLIKLPAGAHKTGGKTKRPREIVVPPILVRALERHRANPWTHPTWVFTHQRGRNAEERGGTTAATGVPWTSSGLSIRVKNMRREAVALGERLKAEGKPTRGLERIRDEGDNRFVLYRLRHTRITDLIGAKGGLSHDQAAALTGTSARMIEQVYGHLTGSRLADLDQAARARQRPAGK